MNLLLDTCTFLWLTLDATAFSALARQLFSEPGNPVFLSSGFAWEICVQYNLGRLPLPVPTERFVPAQRRRHGMAFLPFEESDALHEPCLARTMW